MSVRLIIALLIFLMVNAVLFGIGLIVVVTFPALNARAMGLIPVVVLLSFVLAAPLSWYIAPKLRARYWKHHTPAPRMP